MSNPFENDLNLLFSGIQIYNTAGSLVFRNHVNLPAIELMINGSAFQRGVYFIKVITGRGEGVIKLVKM